MIRESQKVELLGVIIDNKLTFKDHINTLSRRASYKVHALRRIRKYLTFEKAKLLCNAFINMQYNYASIIWMFCRKQHYLNIQNIHFKALSQCFLHFWQKRDNFFSSKTVFLA